jgi:hypothetical protein
MDVSEKPVFTLKGIMEAAGSCRYISVSLNPTTASKNIINLFIPFPHAYTQMAQLLSTLVKTDYNRLNS